jgi:putative pyruvate formate lyase activating enzyme
MTLQEITIKDMKPEITSILQSCSLCPRGCGVDRTRSTGFCKSTDAVRVNIHQLHHWEEPVISGTRGSGTIFFSNCTMKCVYCQNYSISQYGHGDDFTIDELAGMMLELQGMQAHNINLVTPSHYTPLIAEAIHTARDRGLAIPIVWNSNAYEKSDTMRMVDGLVDIYLPDFRYAASSDAEKYSNDPDYPAWAKRAIIEMHRQTGTLVIENGCAVRGLLVRLLVLPGKIDSIKDILEWMAKTIGNDTYVSLMGQYYPTYRSGEFPEINRHVTKVEYETCIDLLEQYGFENGFVQEVGSNSDYTPDFKE